MNNCFLKASQSYKILKIYLMEFYEFRPFDTIGVRGNFSRGLCSKEGQKLLRVIIFIRRKTHKYNYISIHAYTVVVKSIMNS